MTLFAEIPMALNPLQLGWLAGVLEADGSFLEAA